MILVMIIHGIRLLSNYGLIVSKIRKILGRCIVAESVFTQAPTSFARPGLCQCDPGVVPENEAPLSNLSG